MQQVHQQENKNISGQPYSLTKQEAKADYGPSCQSLLQVYRSIRAFSFFVNAHFSFRLFYTGVGGGREINAKNGTTPKVGATFTSISRLI